MRTKRLRKLAAGWRWRLSYILGTPIPADLDEDVAAIVDEEVKKLIATAHQEAFDILEENRDVLDSLVLALMEKETLDKEQVGEIFAPLRRRPTRPADPAAPRRLLRTGASSRRGSGRARGVRARAWPAGAERAGHGIGVGIEQRCRRAVPSLRGKRQPAGRAACGAGMAVRLARLGEPSYCVRLATPARAAGCILLVRAHRRRHAAGTPGVHAIRPLAYGAIQSAAETRVNRHWAMARTLPSMES